MWQDASASFSVAHRSITQILMMVMVRHGDIVYAAYYLGLHLWMLPGGGEVWMRVPSVLAAGVSARPGPCHLLTTGRYPNGSRCRTVVRGDTAHVLLSPRGPLPHHRLRPCP